MMNNRCFYIIILLFTLGIFSGCTSSSKPEEKEPVVEENTYEQTSPSYNYTPASESYTPTPTVQEEPPIDQKMSEEVLKVAASTLSRWYQEGYDNGYDDGEDDALGRNGYRGQYDDSCKYKGKKRREYQLGYAEGYEAGFDDNVADDGSDDEYK